MAPKTANNKIIIFHSYILSPRRQYLTPKYTMQPVSMKPQIEQAAPIKYVFVFCNLDKQHAIKRTQPKMVKGKGKIDYAVSAGS